MIIKKIKIKKKINQDTASQQLTRKPRTYLQFIHNCKNQDPLQNI